LQAIDALPENDLDKVRERIDQLTRNTENHLQLGDVENWISNPHTAIDEFREGLSETELREIVNSMNIGV
jgi:hypothetical protein